METFLVPSASGSGSLEFFERTPTDPRRALERFKVRLTEFELTVVGRVYVGPTGPGPAVLFAQMAAHWKGWQGDFTWESPAGELALHCARDRAGHVAIRVTLRSGPGEDDWLVRATILTEAGQLETLARRAAAFFGPDAGDGPQ
jgi:hypothetical protein